MRSNEPSGGEKVCVAQIGGAHGLKGEVRLFSFTEVPEDVIAYGPLTTENGRRQLAIASLRPAKDHFVARFEGVGDRNAAEMLRNTKLYVAREKLPPLEDEDTYYHADLLGLTATYPDGRTLGTVTAVHNFGASDLLEIARADEADTVLLPFTDRVVAAVDVASQRIVVDPPEGALDSSRTPRAEADEASSASAPPSLAGKTGKTG